MNILINAISARLGGGQTYLVNLLTRIPSNEGLKVFLLAPESLEILDMSAKVTRLDVPKSLVTSLIWRSLWEKYMLPSILQENQIDILFCPGGSLNGNFSHLCKTAVTFQNMLPFDVIQVRKYGFSFSRLRNIILKSRLLKSMKKADLVIFISEHAKTVIQGLLKREITNTTLIPHGADSIFRRVVGTTLAQPEWLPNNGYLLYVSPLDVYKAQLEVVRGYSFLKKKGLKIPKLVLVGTPLNKSYTNKVMKLINKLDLLNDIILKGHLEYQSLPAVYQNASINIFASETENCPFILLEALSSGRPLLSSNRPPMPEFAGEAALYFDPSDPHQLAEKLHEMLADKVMLEKLSQLSLEKSFQYDWSMCAKKTWDSLISLGST